VTTVRQHVSNVLNRAELGRHVDDDDLAKLPEVLHDQVRAASARIVAFKAAGDGIAARRDKQASLEDVLDAALAAAIDINGAIPEMTGTERRALAEHLFTEPETSLRSVVDAIPRGTF
jgi:hypothetical protein